jgi:hypothetical protein
MCDGYGNIQRIYEESSSLADLRKGGNEMIAACREVVDEPNKNGMQRVRMSMVFTDKP